MNEEELRISSRAKRVAAQAPGLRPRRRETGQDRFLHRALVAGTRVKSSEDEELHLSLLRIAVHVRPPRILPPARRALEAIRPSRRRPADCDETPGAADAAGRVSRTRDKHPESPSRRYHPRAAG